MSETLAERAKKNVQTIVRDIFEISEENRSLIVFDTQSELSRALAEGYRHAIPNGTFISFDETEPEEIIAEMNQLTKGDFVALIQTTNFRLNEFRIRVELFKKGLKVIEHPHLGRMKTSAEAETYIDALHYDKEYYRGVGRRLKEKIDKANKIVVESNGSELVYESAFEDAKLNVGDYSGMRNIGGQFPIGEVFTEPSDLMKVNGRAKLMAFGDRSFTTNIPKEPVEIIVKEGEIVDVANSTDEFDAVLAEIREEETAVLRELGFGLNRAMTKERVVTDIGTYERMCGIHLSIGGKHTIYAKKEFSKKKARFHVDVFVDVSRVTIDGETVFENGKYIV